MATVKRKAVTDDRPNKKVKSSKGGANTKPAKPAKSEVADAAERRPLAKSVLQQEERAFPRGGGSVLTPIEQKQIHAQAERDVLFEQQTGKPAVHAHEDGDLFDQTPAAVPAKKKQRRQSSDKEHANEAKVPVLKVHSLSYKVLSIGTVVLGYVTAITNRDIELAFANNLSGYVPITAVSQRLNVRIDKLLDAGEQEGEEDEDIELKQLFYVGQWLRATVTATTSESTDGNEKNKRHIELSVDPQHTNGGLDADGVPVSSMVQASVRSVEDHGIVMDLGFPDASVKGFISEKELRATHNLDDIQEGQVMLCVVTSKSSNGKVFNLSPSAIPRSAIAEGKQAPTVHAAPTVDGFQPGTAVDLLITDSGPIGVAAKVMGILDITADLVHCGAGLSGEEIAKKYKVGMKTKGRIIWAVPKEDGSRRIGVSLLEHLLNLPPPLSKLPENASSKLRDQATTLGQHFSTSSIVDDARVTNVMHNRGLFIQLPLSTTKKSANAFAHISQVSDNRIDVLTSTTGQYRIDSTHRARILSYSAVDDLYYVSLKSSILEQQFLRIEDLTVGELVKGKVERLILGAKGISGVLVKLSENITGLVPEIHLSDARLEHPERKFKEGFPVKARVLSVDLEKRHVRLTLKKTLVNEDDSVTIWKDYAELQPGMESKGTIVNLLQSGAAVQFFGNVRAWLPVSEMSDAFIETPEKHFRLGQTVHVRILSVDSEAQQMKVSCKDPVAFDEKLQDAWDSIVAGELLSGTVAEKSPESVTVELVNGLKGSIRVGHLSENAVADPEKSLKKIHVEKKLSDLVVLHTLERSRHVLLTRKANIVEDAKAGVLIRSFADVVVGKKANGFVRNVTPEGIYVEFAGGLVGLLPKSQIAPEMVGKVAFGLSKDQSLSAWVLSVDTARERFTLSMKEQAESAATPTEFTLPLAISNPADPSITSVADLTMDRVTKARIVSIKGTQLNVRLGDKIPGRVDVSEAFDRWEDITNKRAPLQKFKTDDVIDVKILGIHDSRNHRFLPISHRQSSAPVYELSAKQGRIESGDESGLRMDSVLAGSEHLAFVNNHGENCVWVNVSPNVRGRIALMDLSDDAGQLQNLNKHFPIGCALRVTVKSVDAANNRLALSANTGGAASELTLQDISSGMLLTGRVTKVTERAVNVQISDSIGAAVPLSEISDDYDNLQTNQYNKNDIVRVSVLDVDTPNKRVFVSLRPSRVLSSSLPVKDTQISSYAQLKVGDILRGFVKHIADEKGVYVSLGGTVDAFVRISDLSDKFIKDWKSIVEIDQLVKGRITQVDAHAKHALLSLKASHVDENYVPPVTLGDLKPGMVVTGKVRKVEDFGAFIDIDNTQPRLSGLCHRSEVAEKRVEDVRELYAAGDIVKAKVLKVDVEARKISLGLKASYFPDAEADEEMEDGDEVDGGAVDSEAASQDDEMEMNGGVDLDDAREVQSDENDLSDASDAQEDEPKPPNGLRIGGFNWTGDSIGAAADVAASDSDAEVAVPKKRKRQPDIKIDMTGDLDKYGSRSVSDFERQLLGQPNDSGLWIQYMAFQLQLSEVQRAREIAERALRTIHIREGDEKANVWIARMNLEVEYGDDERVQEVFKEACQLQDPLEMHEKLASIYIDSGKHVKADAIFEAIVGNKVFRASPEMWLNYANFLMDTLKAPARARVLLSRALQSIPTNEHRLLTAKFAAMEFRSSQGDAERGRTIFEGLVSEWPKWSSGWDMFVDLERSRIAHLGSDEAKLEATHKVRALHERMAAQKMKKRRAKFVFKRWLEFEEAEGSGKDVDRVKALAKEYVESQAAAGGQAEVE